MWECKAIFQETGIYLECKLHKFSQNTIKYTSSMSVMITLRLDPDAIYEKVNQI